MGIRDEDTITSLAGRIARLDREVEPKDRKEIEDICQTLSPQTPTLRHIINNLIDSVDPDIQIEKAKAIYKTDSPTEQQVKKATEELIKVACTPFDNPKLRNVLIEKKKQLEQIIDKVSTDVLIGAGFDAKAKEKAQKYIQTFKKFIEENKDELTALQIIYSKPYKKRFITFEQINQLAEAIRKPPYLLTTELLWKAYEQLDKSKVKGAGPQKLLTNIVSLIRFTIGEVNVLEPFAETVNRRFIEWVAKQKKAGVSVTPEQMDWLVMIKEHIATSMSITMDDFENVPFNQKGGRVRVFQIFGKEVEKVLEELNESLVA
jgi:type I restriction enzyme R subunit